MKSKFIAAVLFLTAVNPHMSRAQDAAAGVGDPEHGAIVFKQCLTCHTNEQGKNKIGPSLFGIVGRPSGSIPDFPYSTAMKSANKTWDEATLNTYLTKPQAMVPGTKMTFFGLPKPQDRLDVIAYLKTLK